MSDLSSLSLEQTLGGLDLQSSLPYTEAQLTEYEQRILEAEELQDKAEALTDRAKVMGWELEWKAPLV